MTASATIRPIPAEAFVAIPPARERPVQSPPSAPAAAPARSGAGAGRSALTVFAIRVMAAGLAYAVQVLMARLTGSADYGIVAAVTVWIAILGHAATLGFSQGASRFVPADQARGDLAAVRGFVRGGAALSIAAGSAAALGLGALVIEGSLLGGAYAAPVAVAALVLPFFALQDFLEGVARSQNWAVLAIAPPYLLRQGLTMAALLAAAGAGVPAGAGTALLCILAATVIAVAAQAARLAWRLSRVVPPGPRRYRWRAWLPACLPIAVADLGTAAFSVIDVVILSLTAPPATVGLYFAATRIQQFVAFVPYAATAATAHRFAVLSASGEGPALQKLVRDQACLTALGTVLVGAGVLVVAPWLLDLFGPAFRGALPILAILVAGSAAASLFGPGEHLLTMLGGERRAAGITLVTLALGGLLCFAAIPALGMAGAALAMAAAAVARAAAMAVVAHAVHGIATPVVAFPGPGLRDR